MSSHNFLAGLRDILAEFYSDELSIRRVVADASLNASRIEFGTTAQNTWQSIITEAQRVNQIEILCQVLARDYGTNPLVQNTLQIYRQTSTQADHKKDGSGLVVPGVPSTPFLERV